MTSSSARGSAFASRARSFLAVPLCRHHTTTGTVVMASYDAAPSLRRGGGSHSGYESRGRTLRTVVGWALADALSRANMGPCGSSEVSPWPPQPLLSDFSAISCWA